MNQVCLRVLGHVAFVSASLLLIPTAFGSSDDELRQLRKGVDALRSSQKEIQKNVQIIKFILMGKQAPLEDVFISIAGAPDMGEKTAKVTMVELSDYQCPFCQCRFCGRHATQTKSQVLEATPRIHFNRGDGDGWVNLTG